jgi:hypothetical protein
MTNKTTRTNEQIFKEFDEKFLMGFPGQTEQGKHIYNLLKDHLKQFIANIRKQDQEDFEKKKKEFGIKCFEKAIQIIKQ